MNGVLDVARGAYSRMPPGLRMRLGGALKLVPVQWQYGATYGAWRAQIAAVQRDSSGVRIIKTARGPNSFKPLSREAPTTANC